MEDILIKFQIYLNDKKLINNHDWDFEKEAKKFIKQRVHDGKCDVCQQLKEITKADDVYYYCSDCNAL